MKKLRIDYNIIQFYIKDNCLLNINNWSNKIKKLLKMIRLLWFLANSIMNKYDYTTNISM